MNAPLQFTHERQRGAATLVVVMVLFLVMALLAAYANRSLLFEQRIATSYFRASLSQEVAEAGVEWTLAQLNGTAADAACAPVATGGQRFVDRYLATNYADRRITPVTSTGKSIADCARDLTNSGWSCRCPAASAAHTTQATTGGGELTPSFNVGFKAADRSGTVMLKVVGCTDSVADNCGANMDVVSKNQLALTKLTVRLALVSAVRSPPASALVVKGNLSSTGAGLGLHNSDASSGGMLAALGGSWTGKIDSRLEGVPGTAPSQLVVSPDDTLNAATTDVFKMFMGSSAARYTQHPSLRILNCQGDCTNAIQTAYDAGQRILWVQGNLTLSSNQTLGSVANPLLLIATGNVTLTGPFQFNGMLVAQGSLNWSNTSTMPSMVNGIVLVGGSMTTAGLVDIVYQQTVADQLRNRMGSYVRIPGGWIDSDAEK